MIQTRDPFRKIIWGWDCETSGFDPLCHLASKDDFFFAQQNVTKEMEGEGRDSLDLFVWWFFILYHGMVNHHQRLPFGRISFTFNHLKQILDFFPQENVTKQMEGREFGEDWIWRSRTFWHHGVSTVAVGFIGGRVSHSKNLSTWQLKTGYFWGPKNIRLPLTFHHPFQLQNRHTLWWIKYMPVNLHEFSWTFAVDLIDLCLRH